jgi:hypothetical protein
MRKGALETWEDDGTLEKGEVDGALAFGWQL